MTTERTSYLDAFIFRATKACEELCDKLPSASPLDIISKDDYEKMDRYLESHYGAFREFIDENYVALLIALSVYEDVDMDAKIAAYIVHNIKNS